MRPIKVGTLTPTDTSTGWFKEAPVAKKSGRPAKEKD
jgi:hypothetical protein